MTGKVLVLGASGRFGRNMAEAFWNAGWHVSLFDRKSDDLAQAAQSMDVIVNGWNPAYPDWAAQLPQLSDQVISACKDSGATLLQPANIYVYGAESPQTLRPDTPHAAQNPLGQLRIEMEAKLRAADISVILLRAGDFLDSEASGNWFDQVIAPSLRKARLTYAGNTEIPHAWAWLPDLARAGVALAEKHAELPRFAQVNFPGYTLSGRQMAALGRRFCTIRLH